MATPRPRKSPPGPAPQRGSAWSLLLANVVGLTGILDSAEPALLKLSIDHKTLFLLSLLDTHDQPSALARALCLPRPTVTALVKRAESHGFLSRDAVPGDLRRFRLTLTPSGRNVVRAGREVVERVLNQRLAPVSPADLDAFARVLAAMNQSP
jgi:DNA-binding MarR family transcriptional regulator